MTILQTGLPDGNQTVKQTSTAAQALIDLAEETQRIEDDLRQRCERALNELIQPGDL